MRCVLAPLALFCVSLLPAVEGKAMWMMTGEDVPVQRLLQNIQRHIDANPDDAKGYYVLARVHSLAYAQGGGEKVHVVPAKKGGNLPGFQGWESVQVMPHKNELTAEVFEHLRLSIENYRKAVKHAPNEALYHLGLGWMLDQASLRAAENSATTTTATTTTIATATTSASTQPAHEKLVAEALKHYARAVELALAKDLNREMVMAGTDQAISLEASRDALGLMHRAKIDDPELDKRMRSAYTQVSKLPEAITPIIFPLDEARPLSHLLDPTATVDFDLAGDGIERTWPWVRKNTGILVWDPKESGKITSGRQLFGSATWWMFWDNGYDALAALDDDGDGSLAATELDGIGVWHDRDGDGRSGEGEVVSAAALGIQSIAVRFDRDASGAMSNRRGITMRDGRVLPTYDWTPTGIPTLAAT